MDFDEYQKLAARTGVFDRPDKEYILMYLCMGLAGEAGEVIEKMKKVIRNDKGVVLEEKKELLQKELGDVLWYLSQLSMHLGFSFQEVAKTNIDKLWDRHTRGVVVSEGDTR